MHKTRFVYVVNPGNFAGTPFYAGYEVENLVDRPDELPELASGERDRANAKREWIRSVVRLPKAARRLVRDTLWRRAVKAFGAAA